MTFALPGRRPLRAKLSAKMFAICFVLVESIILLLGFSYYRYSSATLLEAQTEYAKQMVQKSDEYLQLNLTNIRSFFLSVANDNRLRNGTRPEIRSWLSENLIYFMPNASHIHLLVGDRDIVSTAANSWELPSSDYLMQRLSSVIHRGELVWIGPYFSPASGYTVSVAMDVSAPGGARHLLLVDLDLPKLYRALIPDTASHMQGSLLLLGDDSRLVYARPPYGSYSVFDKSFALTGIPESLFHARWLQYDYHGPQSQELFLTRSRTNFVGWQVVWVMDKKTLLGPLQRLVNYTWLLVGLSFLLSLAIAWLISVLISRPIRRIASTMNDVSKGNLDASIQMPRSDELGFLAAQFNRMVARIRQLVEDLRYTEEQRKIADFKALQAQIKPHFLFNTLNTISVVARQGDLNKADSLISALTDQLQYSLDASPAPIPFRDELRSMESYIVLMAARYPGSFDFESDVDPNVLDYWFPKFALQPLVENAIFHGLVPAGRRGTLFIGASDHGDCWDIMIEDGGVGMPEAKLARLVGQLEGNEPSERIGVTNVHRRLRLLFGDRYRIRIESSPDAGTRLLLTLPIVRDPGQIAMQGKW
ncbi:sensor histidine kinase [Paenibacillus flagellatus]|nr:sensor histidine kinase [Paenibacillus flagellatus]